ncbi:glycoside hydrolase family 172 protein [Streptomyces sp. NPDC051597]|uniref:glycoside hydrolase family 172 protein n=1 Tax=Streptomyces sp. NPDC051597 TaxID=3155049 RepID=UPI0034133892
MTCASWFSRATAMAVTVVLALLPAYAEATAEATADNAPTAVNAPAPGTKGPVGWESLRRLDRLPVLPSGVRTLQFSSFDRAGGNAQDGFFGTYSCLRTSGGGCVIAEHRGAGEIGSIWFTRDEGDVTRTGTLTIELDGKKVLDAPLQDVVNGRLGAPFAPPLVANAEASSGGVLIEVPMAFRESMRITTQHNPLFYHVSYRSFADADGIVTFDAHDPAQDVVALIKAAGTRDPKPALPGTRTTTQALSLAPGGTQTLATSLTPGLLTALEIRLPQVSGAATRRAAGRGRVPGGGEPAAPVVGRTLLTALRLLISFDGQRTVDAPLGEFFGAGQAMAPVRALMFATDPRTQTFRAWWPMPFTTRAHVQLYNGSDIPVTAGSASVSTAPSPAHAQAVRTRAEGRFHALSHAGPTVPGASWSFLRTQGRGKFVGVSHSMRGDTDRTYLEGDERVYVDGARTPQLHGTGTEDFYQSGWYFNRGPYTQPFNGNPTHLTASSGCATGRDCTDAYRLQLHDSVAFTESIDYSIEHGPMNDRQADYSSTAFWYGTSTTASYTSDVLHLGDLAGEAAHRYTAGAASPLPVLDSAFEGDARTPTRLRAPTRATRTPVTFTLAIDPRNRGVELRRTSDQQQGPQQAEISVDGHRLGDWYQPLANTDRRWLDDTYQLPAAYTRGRSLLTVTLTPAPNGAAWSAASYEAHSLI